MSSKSGLAVDRGDVVTFGPYQWQVLQVRDGNALIISDHIPLDATYPYNEERKDTTWETCTLRTYLNGELYGRFTDAERSRIVRTELKNADNPWFGTNVGNTTHDWIFLLSTEEVVAYFGDSGQLRNRNPNSKLFINDQYKKRRVAKRAGMSAWWWLRTPGRHGRIASYVGSGGSVNVSGHWVDNSGGAVRPALVLNVGH
jgi:hypothetical protein